jgi:hypothetical protein
MPRDGSNIYHRPVGTDAVTDTTIESTKYNSNVADVEQDLNLPRPIVAGGTGASDATQAMQNLKGELAQQVVTNYSTFAFAPGSFYSAAGATGAPTANAFTGICYASDVTASPIASMTLEARDNTTGILYYKQMTAGVWAGSWTQAAGSTTALDAAYVNVAGDTMTGLLQINGATSDCLNLDLNNLSNKKWVKFGFGGAGAEYGSIAMMNAGVQFNMNTGVGVATWNFAQGKISVSDMTTSTSPTTGALTVAGGLGVGGMLTAGTGIAIPAGGFTIDLSNATTIYRDTANGNLTLTAQSGKVALPSTTASTSPTTGALTVAGGAGVGGNLNCAGIISSGPALTGGVLTGDIVASRNASSGAYFFGTAATRYLQYDGTNFNLVGGGLSIINGVMNHASGSFPLPTGYGHNFGYGGTTQFGMAFRPSNDSSGSNAIGFMNTANAAVGSIITSSTVTSFNTSSSAELKEDLKSFDAGNIIDATNVYDFKWKSSSERGYGVIAQQAVDVYPTAVAHTINPETKDEFWGVDYSRYVPVLLQELKALRARVAQLEGAAARPA